MTYEQAVEYALNHLKETGGPEAWEAIEILDSCNCKFDFSDGTGYCQECRKKVKCHPKKRQNNILQYSK